MQPVHRRNVFRSTFNDQPSWRVFSNEPVYLPPPLSPPPPMRTTKCVHFAGTGAGKDFYAVLGVPKDADEAAVKKAYRCGLCAVCAHGHADEVAQTLPILSLANLRRLQEAGGQASPGQEPGQAGGFSGEVQAGLQLPHAGSAACLAASHLQRTH